MFLTFTNRIKLCFEVLTTPTGQRASEKVIPTFRRGYDAGFEDCQLEYKYVLKALKEIYEKSGTKENPDILKAIDILG